MNAIQPWHLIILLLPAGIVVAGVAGVRASKKRRQQPIPPLWQQLGYPPGPGFPQQQPPAPGQYPRQPYPPPPGQQSPSGFGY
ncbi:hypothetical protein AB0F91_12220 [Amycolatopsis sp. NPDC023774]|uniref:hypothetical protein n=1 Tax=Amycolatopsis sp. NPDC023774 TaxID=3155015 RepID=UPI0033CADE00